MRRGGGGRIIRLVCYILTDPVVFVVFSGRGRSRGGRSGARSGGRSLDGSLNSCEFLGCASYDGGSSCRGRGDLDSTLSLVRSCNGRSRERVGKGRRNARRRVDKFISDRKFSLVEVPSECFVSSLGEDGEISALRGIRDGGSDTARKTNRVELVSRSFQINEKRSPRADSRSTGSVVRNRYLLTAEV